MMLCTRHAGLHYDLSGAVLSVLTRVPALGVREAAHGDESLITRLMMDPGRQKYLSLMKLPWTLNCEVRST